MKKLIGILLVLTMILSLGGAALASGEPGVSALGTDWGTFEIIDDGFGNLMANFPAEYPEEYIVVEDDDTVNAKIEAILKTLTLEEKIRMVSAAGTQGNPDRPYRTGMWLGCARVGVPIVAFYDGPMGVRMNAGYETTRPASENAIAATFDKDAAYDYGVIYGVDNFITSANNQLGSQIDLLSSLSRMRIKDMFGEDWLLSADISAGVVEGMQDNRTMATMKHYLGITNVDEQTLHTAYLAPFDAAIHEGGASSLMTNYEATNAQSACLDDYLNLFVLRDMWGYDGIVMTDWGGNYDFTLDDGVTMETPMGTYNNAENITAALEDGTITEADIDQAVAYNLRALADIGYLGLVTISKDGSAAVDYDAPPYIELPDVVKGEDRLPYMQANNELAIAGALEGSVLVKNEAGALPLKADESVALIGLGSTYLVAGSHGENAFGWLEALAVSPYDALKESMPGTDIKAYVAQDIVGEAIPAKYLYVDPEATLNGVVYEGHDGDGCESMGACANIDFVTNSTDYFNAEGGTAFPYGEVGAAYTYTTYLKAPETGTYSIKLEGIQTTAFSGTIEYAETGETADIAAAAGQAGTGFVATSGVVTNDLGLDIPSGQTFTPSNGSDEPAEDASGEASGFGFGPSGYTEFPLEAGKVYKITVSFDANLSDSQEYLKGTKDTQIRLAWITPSQKEDNYSSAIEAAKTADTSVVFVHGPDGSGMPAAQHELLTDVIAAAKANGHKVVLVLTNGIVMNITDVVDSLDAVLLVWQPGQGGGTVIAKLLSGEYNPTGKLPMTWPADFTKSNATLHTTGRAVQSAHGGPSGLSDGELREGMFIGYKWYDAADLQDAVLYDFGYGLSYTTFRYDLVSVVPAAADGDEVGFDITVKVTNTGSVAGADVPQIYVAASELPNGIYSPYDVAENFHYEDDDNDGVENYFPEIGGIQQVPYQLAGYARTSLLEPGQSEDVVIHIGQRVLSFWDTSIADDAMYRRADGTMDKWTLTASEYTFYVASSADDLLIETTASLGGGSSNG